MGKDVSFYGISFRTLTSVISYGIVQTMRSTSPAMFSFAWENTVSRPVVQNLDFYPRLSGIRIACERGKWSSKQFSEMESG